MPFQTQSRNFPNNLDPLFFAAPLENLNTIFDDDRISMHLDPFRFPDPLMGFVGDPFRLRVQKALTVALRQITPVNGFNCDMSGRDRVVRGFRFIGAEFTTPLVSILEEPFSFEQDLAPNTGRIRSEPYEMILQGFIRDDIDNPTDPAHYLLADVKRRLATLKEDERTSPWIFRMGTQGNAVIGLTFDGGVVRPADEFSPTAHFWLRVSLDVSEDYSVPDG